MNDENKGKARALCAAVSLTWGPASIISYLILRQTKRRTVFVELVIPAQLMMTTVILYLLMAFSDKVFDEETRDHILRDSAFLFLFAYLFFTLLINASWLCGFLMRTFNLILYLACWHLSLKHQVDDIYLATGAHIALTCGAGLMIETVIYLQVKSQARLFTQFKHME